MNNENPWICDLCFPGGIDIGKIADGYYLCFHNGRYFVLAGQGHSNDELFYWSEKPFPDPISGKTDEEIDAIDRDFYSKNMLEIDRIITETDLCLSPSYEHRFVKACIESGSYDQEKDGYNFELWLFNRCGVLIHEYEKEQKE